MGQEPARRIRGSVVAYTIAMSFVGIVNVALAAWGVWSYFEHGYVLSRGGERLAETWVWVYPLYLLAGLALTAHALRYYRRRRGEVKPRRGSGVVATVSGLHLWMVFAAASVCSMLLFALGLIYGLTPSEGCPDVWEVVVFAVAPMLITGAACVVVKGLLRGVLVAEALLIGAAAVLLLWRIGCAP